MRNLLLHLIFIYLPGNAICQPGNLSKIPAIPLTANKIVYTALVNLDTTIRKEKLFYNAEEWYRYNFQSSDNTLTIDNMDNGIISGTGIIHAGKREKEVEAKDVFFTIDISVGKGEYRYKVYGIYSFEDTAKFHYSDMYNEELYPTDKPRWPEQYRRSMLINMNDRITAMIGKLQEAMKK